MVSDRKPEQITRPVRDLISKGIELKQGEVDGINTKEQTVVADGELLSYDYLVIALGAVLVPEAINGLKESAHTFYTFNGSMKLRNALESFQEGIISIVVCGMPYKCPGAPYEGAMLIAEHFKQRGIHKQVNINLYTPEPQPMPVAGPDLGKAVTDMLESKGISYHPFHQLLSVDTQKKTIIR